MKTQLTIGAVAGLTGVPVKTIRFYEDEGLLAAPSRTESGYRIYREGDVARLRLIRRLRLLGLGLPQIAPVIEAAFAADCSAFGDRLFASIADQRVEIDRRLRDLEALRDELDAMERHIAHCCEGCLPTDTAGECGFCGLITLEEGVRQHEAT